MTIKFLQLLALVNNLIKALRRALLDATAYLDAVKAKQVKQYTSRVEQRKADALRSHKDAMDALEGIRAAAIVAAEEAHVLRTDKLVLAAARVGKSIDKKIQKVGAL